MIILATTKEEALAAGVPAELFDPEVHLFKETVTAIPPQTNVSNASLPEAVHEETTNG